MDWTHSLASQSENSDLVDHSLHGYWVVVNLLLVAAPYKINELEIGMRRDALL